MLAALVNTISLFFLFSLTVGITVLVITDAVKFNWVLNVPFIGRYKIQLKKTRGSFSFQMGKASRWVQKAKKKQVEIPANLEAAPESCDPYALSNRFFADDLTENLDTSEVANKRWNGEDTIGNREVFDEQTIAEMEVVGKNVTETCESDRQIIESLSLSTSGDHQTAPRETAAQAVEALVNDPNNDWEGDDELPFAVSNTDGMPLTGEEKQRFQESLEQLRKSQIHDGSENADEAQQDDSSVDLLVPIDDEMPEKLAIEDPLIVTAKELSDMDTKEFKRILAAHEKIQKK